jgi:DNA polymerase-2
MRDKRLILKRRLRILDKKDPERRRILNLLKGVVDGIKWLTVVCYGRLGFANSRFGRLNSHETVSYLSRKVVTQAKLIAEERGYHFLHLYVDSLILSKMEATKEDYQALAEEIERKTHLPMDFDGVIYPWFAFPTSRENPNIGVSNRFYGLSPDGEHKIRGVALRRSDTPLFISQTQAKVLTILAKESDPAKLTGLLPEILAMVREQLQALRHGRVPLDELVVRQKLSRELEEYSVLSTARLVARQLGAYGKTLRRGQRSRFIYISPGPGIYAWDLPKPPDPKIIDRKKYRELLIRAVQDVLQPLGVTEPILKNWLIGGAGYLAPPGLLGSSDTTRQALPLLAGVECLRLDV